MEDLQTLVNGRLRHLLHEHGVTAADAARRARAAGYRVDESRLSQIASMATGERWVLMPHPRTMLGIAVGLDLLIHQVVDAAVRSTGIPVPVRHYASTMETDGDALCTCEPTTRVFDELVVMLPPVALTHGDLVKLVHAIDEETAQQLDGRAAAGHSGDTREA